MKNYLKLKYFQYQAKRWLAANDQDKIAAICLRSLNRVAKHGKKRPYIYHLKAKLIKLWYNQRGYVKKVRKKMQIKSCWTCRGTGWFDQRAICRKCGGSGVYDFHTLYEFHLDINGHSYIWHQPQSKVDYPISYLSENTEEYKKTDQDRIVSYSDDLISLWLVTLQTYLENNGIEVSRAYRVLEKDTDLLRWKIAEWRNKFRKRSVSVDIPF